MAPPPIMLPRIAWLILQGVVPASIDVVGATARADAQETPKKHALTLVTPTPIALSHVISPPYV
jgi:hypothetical protein